MVNFIFVKKYLNLFKNYIALFKLRINFKLLDDIQGLRIREFLFMQADFFS